MKGVIWSYTERIKRINSNGTKGIYITPAKNQVIQLNFVGIYASGIQDAGGTSKSLVNTQIDLAGLWLDVYHLSGHAPIDIELPSNDCLGTFDTVPLQSIYITDKDRIKIARTFQTVNTLMEIGVRAVLSNYSLPTIEYFDANNERHAHYTNRIIGVIE